MKLFKALPLLLLAPMTACGSTTTVLRYNFVAATLKTKNTNNSFYLESTRCNGTAIYSFSVKNEETLAIHSDVKLVYGALTVTLKQGDNELYKDIIIDNFNEDISLKGLHGKFKMTIIHDDYRGSYKFSW